MTRYLERIDLVERMRLNLAQIDRTSDGLLLHYAPSPEVEADLHQFALDEKRCCQFWGFEVVSSESEVTLRWEGPPTAGDLIDRLYDYFQGSEPLTRISGLL